MCQPPACRLADAVDVTNLLHRTVPLTDFNWILPATDVLCTLSALHTTCPTVHSLLSSSPVTTANLVCRRNNAFTRRRFGLRRDRHPSLSPRCVTGLRDSRARKPAESA